MIVDGKRMGLYREEGGLTLVEVLEDKSDEKWERLWVRCVRVVKPSRIVVSPEVGEEWEATGTKGEGSAYKGWYLEEEGAGLEKAIEEGAG